jgi:hypothetical protein
MTLDELEEKLQLPNGWHDASIVRIDLDYISRTAILDVAVWVGALDGEAPETYRQGRLTITQFAFVAIDPPSSSPNEYDRAGQVWVDGDGVDSIGARLPVQLPGTFRRTIFVHSWNAFVHIEARGASFGWTGEMRGR